MNNYFTNRSSTVVALAIALSICATATADASTSTPLQHKAPPAKAKPTKVAPSYTMTNADCMAINLFKEANTATEREQRMVANVVLNRVALNGGTACSQIFAPRQFSWTAKYKQRAKFVSRDDMLRYYDVPSQSFIGLTGVVAEVLLERVVVDYAGAQSTKGTASQVVLNGSSKGAVVMYHDKTVHGFGTVDKKKLKVVAKTKNFIWFSVVMPAKKKGAV